MPPSLLRHHWCRRLVGVIFPVINLYQPNLSSGPTATNCPLKRYTHLELSWMAKTAQHPPFTCTDPLLVYRVPSQKRVNRTNIIPMRCYQLSCHYQDHATVFEYRQPHYPSAWWDADTLCLPQLLMLWSQIS